MLFSRPSQPIACMDATQVEQLLDATTLQPLTSDAYEKLSKYVGLLFRWNAKMNLTAVRDAETLVSLHIAECIYCAQRIPSTYRYVLDFGAGAGLPGIPVQIARPDLYVTLAESQNKKAAFLRECLRELDLENGNVYSGRVEDLPADQQFDVITLRAVDNMRSAVSAAGLRMKAAGRSMILTSVAESSTVRATLPNLQWTAEPIPGTRQRILMIASGAAANS